MSGRACLTSVCLQGDLKAFIYGQIGRALRSHSSAIEVFKEALKTVEHVAEGQEKSQDSPEVFSRR